MKTFNNFLVILVALLSLIGCRDGDNRILGSSSSTKLVDIRISPEPLTVKGNEGLILHKNLTQPFVAVGIYSNGITKNLTDLVNWSTDIETEEPLIEKGFFTPTQSGDVVIKAELEGIFSNSIKVAVTDLEPTSFAVTPSKVTLAKGESQQLNAILSYSDGTSANIGSRVNWDTNNSPLIYLDDAGLVKGISAGVTSVEASYNYEYNQTRVEFKQDVDITVTNEYLSEIQLTPGSISIARDQPFDKLAAKGIISDQTGTQIRVIDLTERVKWTTNNPSVVTFLKPGQIIGARQGRAEIYAQLNDVVATNTVTVDVSEASLSEVLLTPERITVINGTKAQFQVIAKYSDGTFSVLSDMKYPSYWLKASNDTLSILSSGKIVSHNPGSSDLKAYFRGLESNTVTVDVLDSQIESIEIVPRNIQLTKGEKRSLVVYANYDNQVKGVDVTDNVNWTFGQGLKVDEGLLTAHEVTNSSEVTATIGEHSSTTNVTVKPSVDVKSVVLSLANNPNNEVIVGTSLEEPISVVVKNYNDEIVNTPNTVAYIVSEGAKFISIDNNGTIRGDYVMANGDVASVRAIVEGVLSEPLNIRVVDRTLENVLLEPTSISIREGEKRTLKIRAQYKGGIERNLGSEDLITLIIPNDYSDAVAFNSNTFELYGLSKTDAPFDLKVGYGNRESNTVKVKVTEEDLNVLSIENTNSSALIKGIPYRGLIAKVRINGVDKTLTGDEVWWSVEGDGYINQGVLYAETAGALLKINAHYGGMTTSSPFEIMVSHATDNEFDRLVVTPAQFTVLAHDTSQELEIRGYYMNGEEVDLSESDEIKFSTLSGNELPNDLIIDKTRNVNNKETYRVYGNSALKETVVVTYKAGNMDFTSNFEVNVGKAPVQLITVRPTNLQLPIGTYGQLDAFVTFKGEMAPEKMNERVSWRSSDEDKNVFISTTGKISSNLEGSIKVWAEYSGQSSEKVDVEFTNAQLESLSIEAVGYYGDSSNGKVVTSYSGGEDIELKIMGHFSNDSSIELKSDDGIAIILPEQSGSSIVSVNNPTGDQRYKLSTSASFSEIIEIRASYGTIESDPLYVKVDDAIVEKIKIKHGADETDASISLPLGLSTNLTVYGLYSGEDDIEENWKKLSNANVKFKVDNPAYVTHLADSDYTVRLQGESTANNLILSATYISDDASYSVNSANVDVTLTDPSLLSIEFRNIDDSVLSSVASLNVGQKYDYKLMARYSNDSEVDITASNGITYSLSSNDINISSPGSVEAINATQNMIEITAQYETASTSFSITEVKPRVLTGIEWGADQLSAIPPDAGLDFVAYAVFSNGDRELIGDKSTGFQFFTSNPSLATISKYGISSREYLGQVSFVIRQEGGNISSGELHLEIVDNLDLSKYGSTKVQYNYRNGNTNSTQFKVTVEGYARNLLSLNKSSIGGAIVDNTTVKSEANGIHYHINMADVNVSTQFRSSWSDIVYDLTSDKDYGFSGGNNLSTVDDSIHSLVGKFYYVLVRNVFTDGMVLKHYEYHAFRDCIDTSLACIDIVDSGNGMLFTSSPSQEYIDQILPGTATDGTQLEDGSFDGPPDGSSFYRFNFANAEKLCDLYNTNTIRGRTNWRLPTEDELLTRMFGDHENINEPMPTGRQNGWPNYWPHWTSTVYKFDSSKYVTVNLSRNRISSVGPSFRYYVTCVSD